MSPEMLALLLKSFWETCYMVLASTILATLIGVPLGVILTVTRKPYPAQRSCKQRFRCYCQRYPLNSLHYTNGSNHSSDPPFSRLFDRYYRFHRTFDYFSRTLYCPHHRIFAAGNRPRRYRSGSGHGRQPHADYPQGPFAGSTAFHRFRYHPRCYSFDRLFRHGWYIRRRRLRRSGDPLRLSAFPNGRYADHCRRTYRYGPIYPVTRRLLFQKA